MSCTLYMQYQNVAKALSWPYIENVHATEALQLTLQTNHICHSMFVVDHAAQIESILDSVYHFVLFSKKLYHFQRINQ